MQQSRHNEHKALKIVHLIYTMEVGGAETMLVDIINSQIERGHDVTLLIVNRGVNADLLSHLDSRVKLVRMERRQGSRPLLMMMRLNILLARMRPDVIHVHNHKFCRLVQYRRSHLVFTAHEVDAPMQYASTARIVAITDAVKADILARVPTARVTTVFNGIRVDTIARRKPTGTLPSTLKIVQVGRLTTEIKGQDILVKALGILSRRGMKNIEVTFVGTGADRQALEELAKAEGVADRVHFTGLRDRAWIYSKLKNYDMMCHPSRSEGFGLTVAEGMAAGLPLAVTEGDGPWEVAADGRLCAGFPAGSPEGCADAIAAVMADWKGAEARAAEGLDYVRRFDIATTVDAYIAYYRQMLAGR